MTAELEGVGGQQHAPATLYPRERHGTHFTGGWVGPRAGLDGRKPRPHRNSIPDRPTRSQSLYRLSFPAQPHFTVGCLILARTLPSLFPILQSKGVVVPVHTSYNIPASRLWLVPGKTGCVTFTSVYCVFRCSGIMLNGTEMFWTQPVCCPATPLRLGFGSGNLTEGTRTKRLTHVGQFGGNSIRRWYVWVV